MEQFKETDAEIKTKIPHKEKVSTETRPTVKSYNNADELPEEAKEQYLTRKKSIDKSMNALCFVLIIISMGISALITMSGKSYGSYPAARLITLPIAIAIWCLVRSSKMSELRREFNIKK